MKRREFVHELRLLCEKFDLVPSACSCCGGLDLGVLSEKRAEAERARATARPEAEERKLPPGIRDNLRVRRLDPLARMEEEMLS